jgi:hypothetical protein
MEERLKQLEDRVAHLERELREVRVLLAAGRGSEGWRAVAASFPDEELLDEVNEEIRKLRAADREAAGCTTPDPFGTPVRQSKTKKARTRKAE